MHAPPFLVLLGWSTRIIEYPLMDNALPSFEIEESRFSIHKWYQICGSNWKFGIEKF